MGSRVHNHISLKGPSKYVIDHPKLRFVAAKPPPSHVFEQVARPMEENPDYF
jgi:hypothetical protein